jgi:hypothetical protein
MRSAQFRGVCRPTSDWWGTTVLVDWRGHVTGWRVAGGLQAVYRGKYGLSLALDGDGDHHLPHSA